MALAFNSTPKIAMVKAARAPCRPTALGQDAERRLLIEGSKLQLGCGTIASRRVWRGHYDGARKRNMHEMSHGPPKACLCFARPDRGGCAPFARRQRTNVGRGPLRAELIGTGGRRPDAMVAGLRRMLRPDWLGLRTIQGAHPALVRLRSTSPELLALGPTLSAGGAFFGPGIYAPAMTWG